MNDFAGDGRQDRLDLLSRAHRSLRERARRGLYRAALAGVGYNGRAPSNRGTVRADTTPGWIEPRDGNQGAISTFAEQRAWRASWWTAPRSGMRPRAPRVRPPFAERWRA